LGSSVTRVESIIHNQRRRHDRQRCARAALGVACEARGSTNGVERQVGDGPLYRSAGRDRAAPVGPGARAPEMKVPTLPDGV